MTATHGTVHWTELMTRDVAGARAFYTATCGWEWDKMPMPDGGEYHTAKLGDTWVAGVFDMTTMPGSEAMAPQWMTYLAVDDVDATVAATTAAGGHVLQAPYDVPGVGRIAMITDPGGAMLGLMTPS